MVWQIWITSDKAFDEWFRSSTHFHRDTCFCRSIFKFFILTYRYFFNLTDFDNLIHVNMCNLLVQVFRRILRTSISLSMTVRSAVHLTQRRSRRLMSSTYSREISYRTLSSWVRWVLIRMLGPLVPSMMLLMRCRMTLLVRPPECPRHGHRRRQDTSVLTVKFGRETHTVRLSFGGCFVSVDVFFSHLWF
jgi:hypothetical protein